MNNPVYKVPVTTREDIKNLIKIVSKTLLFQQLEMWEVI